MANENIGNLGLHSFPSFFKNEEDKHKQKELWQALKQISCIISSCNKNNFISKAHKLMHYLDSPNEIVASYAAIGLAQVIELTKNEIVRETDPTKVTEIIGGLIKVIDELNIYMTLNLLNQNIKPIIKKIIENTQGFLRYDKDKSSIPSLINGSKEDEFSAILRISLLLAQNSKTSSISSAKAVLKYLTHDSPLVRKLALEALTIFIALAIVALVTAGTPEKQKEISNGLEEIFTKLQDMTSRGDIPLEVQKGVNNILKSIMQAISDSQTKNITFDEFVSSDNIDKPNIKNNDNKIIPKYQQKFHKRGIDTLNSLNVFG